MPRFASRNVLVAAGVFAVFVVFASVVGTGGGELFLYLLYVGALLGALYFVVRWAVAAGVADAGGRGAREVLDARYAAGEISRDEYARMRRDLETP